MYNSAKILLRLRCTKIIIIFLVSLSDFSCRQSAVKKFDVCIYPYEIAFFSNINKTEEMLESFGITLEYEDSHKGADDGLSFNYFGSSFDSLEYYVELYSLDDRVEGVKAVIYSKPLRDELFFDKIDKNIIRNFKPIIGNNLLVDTLRENKASQIERNQYTIYIRTGEVDNILQR